MDAPARDPALQSLIDFAPIKVWSMVVTIMGDLCRTPEDRIGGQALGRIMEEMGVTNQALRTALHRLKRDGWVEALREGRGSTYSLTPTGRERTESVRPVLYATGRPAPAPVFLIVGNPSGPAKSFEDMVDEAAVLIAPRIALSTDPSAPPDAIVQAFDAASCPDWIRAEVAPPDLVQEYALLTTRLGAIKTAPDTPLDALVTRLLALHHWRRLRLRHGDLPDLMLGDWPGDTARDEIARLLALLPRPARADLAKLADA